MKSLHLSFPRPLLFAVMSVAVLGTTQPGTAYGQGSKKPRAKAASTDKVTGKAKPKAPGATTSYDQYLIANMKLLNVLSRYAGTLAEATDAASAGRAVTRIEGLTKDAIIAGEELVRLGRPSADVADRLANDADLQLTSRNVAEQTRTAIRVLAANSELKGLLTPSIENFQAALNRIQEAADDPQGPGSRPKSPASTRTETAATPPASAPSEEVRPAARASEAASVPPPPPPE
jgi:hypothetical protein